MSESCPIGTRERLLALLGGELPTAERDALKAHLERPCETCLDLLESIGDDDLFEAAAGPRTWLSAEEAERMFEAVAPPEPTRDAGPGLMDRLVAWLRPAVLVPVAAAAVLVVAFGLYSVASDEGAPEQVRYTGVKGAGDTAPHASPRLAAFVGSAQDGTPRVLRRLTDETPLTAGELVLLRCTLGRPAFVYLLAESDDEASLLHASEARLPAGEHELTADGQVLAVDPSQLGPDLRLVLVTSPGRIADPEPAALLDAGQRAAICPRCAATSLRVRSEPPR